MSSKHERRGWLTAPVVPTEEEERAAAATLVRLRAIDHLRACKMWRHGHCPFEGCNDTAQLLFHDLPLLRGPRFDPHDTRMPRRVCPASDVDRLRELFRLRDPKELRRLPMLVNKFHDRLPELLEQELEKRHLPATWCATCVEAQALRRKHSQFCQLPAGTCQVPLCLALRERNAALNAARPTAEECKAERQREHEWCVVRLYRACCIHPCAVCIGLFCPNVDEADVEKWNAGIGCACVFLWFSVILLYMFLGHGVDT